MTCYPTHHARPTGDAETSANMSNTSAKNSLIPFYVTIISLTSDASSADRDMPSRKARHFGSSRWGHAEKTSQVFSIRLIENCRHECNIFSFLPHPYKTVPKVFHFDFNGCKANADQLCSGAGTGGRRISIVFTHHVQVKHGWAS